MKNAKKFLQAIFSGKYDPKNNYSKCMLRGFIYDTKSILDDGTELSKDKKRHPWPFFLFRSRITGKLISQEEYQKLDEGKKIGYYKVKYLDVVANGESERLFEDTDMVTLNKLFVRLVLCGDPAEAALFEESVDSMTEEMMEGVDLSEFGPLDASVFARRTSDCYNEVCYSLRDGSPELAHSDYLHAICSGLRTSPNNYSCNG